MDSFERHVAPDERKRAVVKGGAGFVESQLRARPPRSVCEPRVGGADGVARLLHRLAQETGAVRTAGAQVA